MTQQKQDKENYFIIENTDSLDDSYINDEYIFDNNKKQKSDSDLSKLSQKSKNSSKMNNSPYLPSKRLDCNNKSSDDSNNSSFNKLFISIDDKQEKSINRKKNCNCHVNHIDSRKVFKNEMTEDKKNEEVLEKTKLNKIITRSQNNRFAMYDDKIGEGQFKRVFRGYDYDSGKEIAWNVITLVDLTDAEVENLEKEISLLKKIKHERILNYIYGWFDDEKNEVILITELFTGGSLKQYLQTIEFPRIRAIKQWIIDILSGLKYLHDMNIIHRDIKCDNIFINKNDGHIKIGDLGFSCLLHRVSYAKSLSGTPEFMAPEVLKGKYGISADIYSFGLCLLEIITMETPYKECDSIAHVFDKLKLGELPQCILKIKNHHMSDFIKLCLTKEEERPTAGDLLENDFLKEKVSEENNLTAIEDIMNPVLLVKHKYKKYNMLKRIDPIGNINDYDQYNQLNQMKDKDKDDIYYINNSNYQNYSAYIMNNHVYNHNLTYQQNFVLSNRNLNGNESKIDSDHQMNKNIKSKMNKVLFKSVQSKSSLIIQNQIENIHIQPIKKKMISVMEGEKSIINIVNVIILKSNSYENLKIEFEFDLNYDNVNIILNELEIEGIITIEEERKEVFQKLRELLDPLKIKYFQYKNFYDEYNKLIDQSSHVIDKYISLFYSNSNECNYLNDNRYYNNFMKKFQKIVEFMKDENKSKN